MFVCIFYAYMYFLYLCTLLLLYNIFIFYCDNYIYTHHISSYAKCFIFIMIKYWSFIYYVQHLFIICAVILTGILFYQCFFLSLLPSLSLFLNESRIGSKKKKYSWLLSSSLQHFHYKFHDCRSYNPSYFLYDIFFISNNSCWFILLFVHRVKKEWFLSALWRY